MYPACLIGSRGCGLDENAHAFICASIMAEANCTLPRFYVEPDPGRPT
jgi:hypothetical protein